MKDLQKPYKEIGAVENPEKLFADALDCLARDADYKKAYDDLLTIYNSSALQTEALAVLTEAFYEPNEKELKNRYNRNCRLLKKYPYIFRKNFLKFADLPLRFYPYDDESYWPFDGKAFLPRVTPGDAVISRNFFADLDQPILAKDVFSQYELEYLVDNVRASEEAGYENHLYLHYSDWDVFCAWLQVLDFAPLLDKKKIVLLIGDELTQYPIDFKARFGIDYSLFTPQPIHIRDVKRLIWHVQLSSHNGGDYFNEIFDDHPNLIQNSSVMMESIERYISLIRRGIESAKNLSDMKRVFRIWDNDALVEELSEMEEITDKDLVVAFYLSQKGWNQRLDQNARIFPALFIQPHFHQINYLMKPLKGFDVYLESKQAELLETSPIVSGFKYVKSFTPMRRITTSYGGAVRFILRKGRAKAIDDGEAGPFIDDALSNRIRNRSFMIDPDNRLFHDSVLVRYEDAKLNPKAVFSALAAFLDIPYTDSMRYCSEAGERDPHSDETGYYAGFSLEGVYKTYDEYTDDAERTFLEYCFRDAYAWYGYDYHYYNGTQMNESDIENLVDRFTALDSFVRRDWENLNRIVQITRGADTLEIGPDTPGEKRDELLREQLAQYREVRIMLGKLMRLPLRFVNKSGKPLSYLPLLKLDSELLEQPLYR